MKESELKIGDKILMTTGSGSTVRSVEEVVKITPKQIHTRFFGFIHEVTGEILPLGLDLPEPVKKRLKETNWHTFAKYDQETVKKTLDIQREITKLQLQKSLLMRPLRIRWGE
jgi:hypothetical protein